MPMDGQMDEWVGRREGGRKGRAGRWKDGWEKGREGRKRAVTGGRREGGEKAGGVGRRGIERTGWEGRTQSRGFRKCRPAGKALQQI